MNEPVKQHYIPRSYLRFFSTEENSKYLVDAHDIRSNITLRRQAVESICFKKNLYTLNTEDNQANYFLEKFYATDVDAHIPEIHRILTTPSITTITRAQKEMIIFSLLSLYFRTTKFLNGSYNTFERMLEMIMQYKPQEDNVTFTFEDRKYSFKRSEVDKFKAEIKEEYRQTFLVEHFQYWQEFAQRKLLNGISVIKVPEEVPLITSDNPIIIGNHRGNVFDLYDPENIIQAPIDKYHYMFLLPDEDNVDPYTIVRRDNDKWHALTNNRQMEQLSERWIISDVGGIDKHLAQQVKANAPTKENLDYVENLKSKERLLKELKEIAEKNGGYYMHPDVLRRTTELSEMEIFKDDLTLKKWKEQFKPNTHKPMYDIKGIAHKIVYIDTNVISNICKKDGLYLNFLAKYPSGTHILSNSVFSLYELSKKDVVFEMYKKQFSALPSLILDSGISLTAKEVAAYDTGKPIKIDLVVPLQIVIEGKKMHPESLQRLFKREQFVKAFTWWDVNLPDLFNDFKSLKTTLGYEANENLNPKVGQFIKQCVLFLLEKYQKPFWNQMKKKNKEIDIDKFPSLKMMAYVSFYKFFSDNRTPEMNDVIDIIISTTVPYCEVFISETNLINAVKKTAAKDGFISHVQLQTIAEFETQIPEKQ